MPFHPDDAVLAALAAGDLVPDERRVVVAHIERCPACCQVVAAAAASSTASSPLTLRLALGSRRGRRGRRGSFHARARYGRYLVSGELGRGSFGVVLAADDPRLERPVAIKLAAGPMVEARERLAAEGRALARVRHPCVVGLLDGGRDRGADFLVLERVVGPSIDRWLVGNPDRAARVAGFADAADGLAALHAAGVVHRDVKPANLLRGEADGRVRVIDLGLSGGVADPAPGRKIGTPRYMAPEQAIGEAASERSDVFALGIALGEALGAGDRLADLVARMTAADPSARPGRMDAIAAALRRDAA